MVFWRENNANLFINKGKVWSPSKEELESELISKLKQKCEKITLMYDEKARESYLENDKKAKGAILNGESKIEIQKRLSKRIIIDLFQLAHDLSSFYKLDYESLSITKKVNRNEQTIEKVQENIFQTIISLQERKEIKSLIMKLVEQTESLSNICGFEIKDIETERLEIEEKEGNFFKGKYVEL